MAALLSRLPAFVPLAARSLSEAPAWRGQDDRCVPGLEGAGVNASGHSEPVNAAVPLTALPKGATGRVAGVRVAPAAAGTPQDPAVERMALRLIEIGFVEGEALRVVAFGQPGDDPIGVRIGGRGGRSTFALRRVEAACVWVVPDAPPRG
jgi:ferrous iron transport protein A